MDADFLECGSFIKLDNHRIIIGLGKRTWLEKPSDSDSNFYFPDFFLKDPKPWCIHEKTFECNFEPLMKFLEQSKKKSEKITWKSPYKDLFKITFQELQQHFNAGKLLKAVPFVFDTSLSQLDSKTLANSLYAVVKCSQLYSLNAYGFWDSNSGMLGATPETLFRIQKKNELITMACAGTSKDANSLQNNPKELREHQIVIDDIVSTLKPFGDITVNERNVKLFPDLVHLVTPISVKLHQPASFEELVNAMHPTSALGAFPRQAGKQWLLDYQTKIDRRRFGAPVGYVGPKNKDACCFVAIRNVQWDSNEMAIGAGCGVIAESNCENEWQEIQSKIQSIKKLLDL